MKVIIVDDDSLMRIALKTLINWEEYGMTIVGEATDGVEALKLIHKQKPDIMLLDMKMPRMDGIELLHKLNEKNEMPRTIIVSSYDEFELVKEGMRFGASDYILKSELDYDNIVLQLQELCCQIKKEREKVQGSAEDSHNGERSLRILRGELYRAIAERFYVFEEDLESEMKRLGVHVGKKFNYCFVIKLGDEKRADKFSSAPIRGYAMVNVAEEILNDRLESFGLENGHKEWDVFCYNMESELDEKEMKELGIRLVEMLYEYLNVRVYVGVGKSLGGVKGLQSAYDRAKKAAGKLFTMDESRVSIWKETLSSEVLEKQQPFALSIEEIFEALNLREAKRVKQSMQEWIKQLQNSRWEQQTVLNIVQNLHFLLGEYCRRNNVQTEEMMPNTAHSAAYRFEFDNMLQVVEYLELLQTDVANWLQGLKTNGTIEMAKQYMEENFAEELTLGKVAMATGLSPAYLSGRLKQEFGKSYSEYLILLRMECAKKLLISSTLKVYEVGEKVGYPNSFYFTRLFKREIGIAPGEYRTQSMPAARKE